jgi:hypothetical protein
MQYYPHLNASFVEGDLNVEVVMTPKKSGEVREVRKCPIHAVGEQSGPVAVAGRPSVWA